MRTLKITAGLGLAVLVFGIGFLWISLVPPRIKAPAQKDHIIAGVTLWNPGMSARSNQTLIIQDGRITEIRETRPDDGAPICPECYVMPGLIDAHIHTPPKIAIGNQKLFALLYLKYGVTSVRDLGQIDNSVTKLARTIKAGRIAGPRVYRCGPILDGDDPAFDGAVSLSSTQDGIDAVQTLAADDVDCIKVYDRLPKAAFMGVSAEARRQGLPLIGHVPHAVKLSDISNFEIQHYTGIPYVDADPPEGFAYLSQDLIDMSDTDIQAALEIMKTKGLSLLPTNANARARLTVPNPERFPPTTGRQHLPDLWDDIWPDIVSHAETPDAIATELRAEPYALEFLRQARASGIDILAGTDTIMPYVIPGEALHLQIEKLSAAFDDPNAAIEPATRINAQHIDPGNIGQLAVGAYADMLIFKDDPRTTLPALQDWTFLMTEGRLYKRTELDAAVARYDTHFHNAVYEWVMKKALSLTASDYQHTG